MERRYVISSDGWCHKVCADRIWSFKADDIEALFAFYEVGGKKATQSRVMAGLLQGRKVLEVKQNTESVQSVEPFYFTLLTILQKEKLSSFLPELCLPRAGE